MRTESTTSKQPTTYADSRIARAVLAAAMKDYQRQEVKADYERWKRQNGRTKK